MSWDMANDPHFYFSHNGAGPSHYITPPHWQLISTPASFPQARSRSRRHMASQSGSSTLKGTREQNRKWWRRFFEDHPGWASKDPNSKHGDKTKVICKSCLQARLNQEEEIDRRQVLEGIRADLRSRKGIEDMLWASNLSDRIWLPATAQKLCSHLINCPWQPEAVKEQARDRLYEPESSYLSSSAPLPEPAALMSSFSIQPQAIPFPSTQPFLIPFPNNSAPLLSVPYATSYMPPPGLPNLGLATSSSLTPDRSASPMSSVTPSDSASQISGSSHASQQTNKRLRRSTSQLNIGNSSSPAWTMATQQRFEERLLKITASAGLPFTWVQNPEWLDFCSDFLPSAKIPSRKVLSTRILSNVVQTYRRGAQQRVANDIATLLCDGWTGQNKHHIIAFMMAVRRETHTLYVYDASKERKTAENLLVLMKHVIELAERQWNVKVAAFVSDASGESRKARRLLSNERPELITPDCYAHQVNLIVGDYFKVNSVVLAYAQQATEVIGWLRSKTVALAWIQEETKKNGRPLTVVNAVLTRWTSHYLAFKRLLELQNTLGLLIAQDRLATPNQRRILIPSTDRRAQKRADEMVEILTNPIFWHSLARVKNHLEPLAIAANVVQASFCRLDEVLLTFGMLFIQYRRLHDQEDIALRDAVLSSIEQRWAKADQEVFIASVLLNPFIKTKPFKQLQFLTVAGILGLMTRLYRRFFGAADDLSSLHLELIDYLESKGIYADMNQYADSVEFSAHNQGKSPDPIEVLRGITHPGRPLSPLLRLAFHLLSISANSASCERLFSVLGNTLTKLRNRLGQEKLINLAELKMHLRDERTHTIKDTTARVRRFFGQQSDATPASARPQIDSESDVLSEVAQDRRAPRDTSGDPGSDSEELEFPNNLAMLVEGLRQMIAEDSDTASGSNSNNSGTTSITAIRCKIEDLFEFQHTMWISKLERNAVRSLDEELELYELVELDADGEPDVDMDESISAIYTA